MNSTYPADKVIAFIKQANTVVTELAIQADLLADENAKLKELVKNSSAEGDIILEKVASAAQVEDSKIDKFIQVLADTAIITEADIPKYAAACKEDVNKLLDVATQAVTLSEPAMDQGHGYQSHSTRSNSRDRVIADEDREFRTIIGL